MSDASEPLAALRAAVERIDDLHGPVDLPTIDDFDPMEHAARFEDLHGALVSVLADVEHAEQAEPARYGERERS